MEDGAELEDLLSTIEEDDLLELTTTDDDDLLSTVEETDDLLEGATELGTDELVVVPVQAPKSLQALSHAQPTPGSYGPPTVHQPPTVHEYACALAPFFTIAPVA